MLPALWRAAWFGLVMVAVVAVSAGCRAAQPQPTPSAADVQAAAEEAAAEVAAAFSLAATAWDLDYFGPPDASLPLLPNTRASLTFFWDRYAGFDGCNWLLGVYNADADGELRLMPPSTTGIICEPEDLNSQAGTYFSALINVTDYVFEGEQLIANTVDDQRLLTFNPAKLMPMPGTEWALKFWWQEDDEWIPVIPLSTTTITFGADGTAGGSGGCNDYSVTYAGDLQIEKVMEATDTYAELPALTFGAISAQMAACEEPRDIMQQEQGYFVTLGSAAYYFKLGGLLMLLDAKGKPLLVFAAQD